MKRINLILYIGILIFLVIGCKEKIIIPTEEISLRSNNDIKVEVFAKNILYPIHVYDSLGKNVKIYNEIETDSIIRIFIKIPQNGSFKLSNLKDVFRLDFSNNASLLEIDASNISAIDGSLDCSNCNQLTHISIVGNNVIKSIDCNNSVSLNSLNVDLCKNLRMITCDFTNINTLKLDSCTNLKFLSFKSCNSIKQLVLNNTSLETITCVDCDSLRYLCTISCDNLETFYCYNCDNLHELKVPDRIRNLKSFSCSGCPALTKVWCFNATTINDIPKHIIEELMDNAQKGSGICALHLSKLYDSKTHTYHYSDGEFLGPY